MQHASDELLIHAYQKALHLNVDRNFIGLLKQELARRNLLNQVEDANNS